MPSFCLDRRDVPRKIAVSPIKPTPLCPNILFFPPLLLHSFIHIHRVSLPFSFPFLAMPSPCLFLSLPDLPLPCLLLFLLFHCPCLTFPYSFLCITFALPTSLHSLHSLCPTHEFLGCHSERISPSRAILSISGFGTFTFPHAAV